MIDINAEKLIALRDVPSRLPPRPNGRRVHISAVYRWIQRGARGTHLECVRVGGTTYTSLEALQRFAENMGQPGMRDCVSHVRGSRLRERQAQAAAQAADAILACRVHAKRRGPEACGGSDSRA